MAPHPKTPRRRVAAALGLMLGLLAAAPPAAAQSDQEARLREALRRATADLRSLQDGQARLQAEAAEARAQRDRLQQQFDAQAARLAELEARPAVAEPPPELLAELEALRTAARTLQEQNTALQRTLAQWQASQAEAVGVARTKEAERAAYEASFTRARRAIEACEAKNAQLFAAAAEILGLYRSAEFRSLLARSQEPVLGFWRVRLENIVQDHEDRIREGLYHRDPAALAPPPPATPLPGRAASRPPRRESTP